jgi:hypothetical protein
MNEKILKQAAQSISTVFNPLIVPTVGILLVMNYIPAVDYYSFKLKFVLMAIVICSSCLIPLLYLFISNINQKLFNEKWHANSKILFDLFSCLSLFLGAQLLGRLPITGIFKLLLLGSCFVFLIDFIISFRWNISEHVTAIGALWGTLIALNFRYGFDIVLILMGVSLLAGIMGAARIILQQHTPAQVYTGFILGASLMFGFLFFI